VVSNSTPAVANGGGIASTGTLVIIHTTITKNSVYSDADNPFNGSAHGGGVYGTPDLLRNTIVSGNNADGPDGNTGCFEICDFDAGSHNLIGGSAGLGPLANNGGPTQTHALLPGSPAIDAGDNADAPEFDQRGPGFARIVNGTIDIGSYEVQATGAPSSPNLLALSARLSARRGSPDPAVLLTVNFDNDDEESKR
jgi:hypothetical protein